MKSLPPKRLIWLLLPLLPVLLISIGVRSVEKTDMEARARRGAAAPSQRSFSLLNSATWPYALARPQDWCEHGLSVLMHLNGNPWKTTEGGFGEHLEKLRRSQNPEDQAECQKLMDLGKAWYDRLLARYPDLAISYRDVPDDGNGLLRWASLIQRLKTANPNASGGLAFPDGIDLRNWNPKTAGPWLDANRSLIDEIRAIGLMPDGSAANIAADSFGGNSDIGTSYAGALLLDARHAVAEGDIHRALESVRAANGLAQLLIKAESPVFLHAIDGLRIQQQIQNYVLSDILPSLPAAQVDIIAWENAVNPTLLQPADFSRVIKGEWNSFMSSFLLPALSDYADPNTPQDAEVLAEAYAQHLRLILLENETLSAGELPVEAARRIDVDLSWKSRKVGRTFGLDQETDLRALWESYQSTTGLTQAAFAILKGLPVPKDPLSGKPYSWNPVTRLLGQPGQGSRSRQITVPKR